MISAFLPTLGFLLGGGSTDSVLFVAYVLHACVVVACDVLGGDVMPWMCLSATDLLFIERSYAATSSPWSWVSGVVGVWLEPVRSQSWVVLRAASLTLAGSPTPFEIGAWSLCLLLALTPIHNTTAWRRLVLGWISFSEARRAPPPPDDAAHHLVRFICFFSFVALFLVRHATDNPKRLQSALTILTTSVLTCCGLRTAWRQWHSPAIVLDHNHERVAAFYVAYCVVDTVFARGYYRQYFKLLDGWLHHIGTGALAAYLVWQGKAALFAPAMMVETSTILLSLRRTFYDSPLVRWLYDEWFQTLFIFFRVVLPICLIVQIHALLTDDPVILPAFGVFTILNIYWLTRVRQKKNTRNKYARDAQGGVR